MLMLNGSVPNVETGTADSVLPAERKDNFEVQVNSFSTYFDAIQLYK